MVVSVRTKRIIEYLSNVDRYVKIGEIATKLSTTERSIYRDMPEINQLLSSYGLLINSLEGKGIQIAGTKENQKRLIEDLEHEATDDVTSISERCDFLILWLLQQNDFVKTQNLADDVNFSIQTVRNDLDKVNEIIKEFHAKLESKKGSGLRLSGNEISLRHMEVSLILRNLEIETLVAWMREGNTKQHPYLRLLENNGYRKVVQSVYRLVEDMIHPEMSDVSFVEFVLLLAELIFRHDRLDPNAAYYFGDEHGKSQEVSTKAGHLHQKIEAEFGFQLLEIELNYLNWLISLNLSSQSTSIHQNMDFDLIDKVRKFVIFVETKLGVKLHNDDTLIAGLMTHMDRAFARVHNRMFLSNPMKFEIKRDYAEIYTIIKSGFQTIFSQERFPDDEIAYLVLYFVIAVDRLMIKSARVLVVCSSGMGSSKLLANRLEQEIIEIKVKKVTSLMGLRDENLNDYDLIISTVPIFDHSDKVMVVTPLLTAQEVDAIKAKIGSRRNQIIHRNERVEYQKVNTIDQNIDVLQKISGISDLGLHLIENFKVIPLEINGILELNQKVEQYLQQNHLISVSDFRNKLTISDQTQLFAIPNTHLVYFELCSDKIKKPLFLVFTLGKNGSIVNLHGTDFLADTFIIILYPNDDELMHDLLSALAITIIESTYSITIFEAGSEDQIRILLSNKIKQYISELL